MVIGGQAVLLYGEPRVTRDIDITLGVDVDHLPGVLRAAADAGLVARPGDPAAFARRTNVLPLEDPESGIRIDAMFSFTPYERQALERAHRVELEGVGVRFAAVEDLLIHKLVAARPRDLDDVRGILLRTPAGDRAYLRRWLDAFRDVTGRDLWVQFEELERAATG
jgi:hypothetical protein